MTHLMSAIKKINAFFLLMPVLGIICITSGCEDPGSVGDGIIDSEISFMVTDTLSLETATVFMDSVVTQGTGRILFGAYEDEYFGNVTADGYLKFSLGSGSFSPSRDARYDSLTLHMTTSYQYGDTTQNQYIRLHRVVEDIEPDEDEDLERLYNFNSFEYDPQPLAEVAFRPERGKELEVSIPGQLGVTLFEAARNEDDILTDNDDFQDFFKGLVVKGDDPANRVVTGVISEETTDTNEVGEPVGVSGGIKLRLYYSDLGTNGNREDLYYDFPLIPDDSFTHISSRKPEPLGRLSRANDKVNSTETGNHVFVQSGVGLMTRIDLDDAAVENLHDLSSASQSLISATLVLFPVKNTYEFQTPLPQYLSLLVADDQNRIVDELSQSGPIADNEFHKDTYYLFDVTDFIYEELQTEQFTGRGLMLSTSSSLYNRTVDRVVLGGGETNDYQMIMVVIFSELYL